jgi:hypothetical protein
VVKAPRDLTPLQRETIARNEAAFERQMAARAGEAAAAWRAASLWILAPPRDTPVPPARIDPTVLARRAAGLPDQPPAFTDEELRARPRWRRGRRVRRTGPQTGHAAAADGPDGSAKGD